MKHALLQLMRKEGLNIRQGFLLIEIILTSALFVLFVTAFSGVFYYGLQSSTLSGDRLRAVMIAEEGQEAVKSIKNNNFSNLVDGTYGLVYSSSSWNFAGAQDVSGIFTRRVTIANAGVSRKNITVTVTWQQAPDRVGSVSTSARLTNWKTILNLGVGITVNKIVINHGLSKTAADFAPYKVGTTTVTLASSTVFGAGTYTVSETIDPNFTQTFSGDCNASGQITLSSTSSSKLCTITNEEKLAYITLNKTVINRSLSKTTADFAPYKVGSTTVILGAQTTICSFVSEHVLLSPGFNVIEPFVKQFPLNVRL